VGLLSPTDGVSSAAAAASSSRRAALPGPTGLRAAAREFRMLLDIAAVGKDRVALDLFDGRCDLGAVVELVEQDGGVP